VVAGLSHAPCADFAALFGRQHYVDHPQLAQLVQYASRFAAQAGLLAELAQELSEHIGQKADEEVRPHAILFLMPHGTQ
jgi:hypothetical protein